MNIQKILDDTESIAESTTAVAAIPKLERCLNNQSVTPLQRIKILELLGKISYRNNKFEDATKYLDQAESLAKREEDSFILVKVQISYGNLLDFQGRYLDALSNNKRSLQLLETLKVNEEVIKKKATLSFGIAKTLWKIGSYTEAIEYAQKSLAQWEKVSTEPNEKYQALQILGTIFSSLKNREKAEFFMKEAIQICEAKGLLVNLAIGLQNLAEMIGSLSGDYEEAYEIFVHALEIARKIGSKYNLVITLNNLCATCIELHKFDEAKRYIEEALSLTKYSEPGFGVTITTITYGNFLYRTGKLQEGIALLKDALSTGSLPNVYRTALLRVLTEAYEEYGNFKEALHYDREEKNLLVQEVENKKAALEEYRLYLLNQEHERQKEIENMKVQKLEQDLTNKTLQLVQQTNMLLTLRKDLDGIVRKADTAEKAVRSIREKLKEIPEHLLNWEKFSEEFHKVHPDFDVNLKKKYPSLSKTEIKVCCLLRIGMNTREISTLLFLSERTVEIHRQHIRKKLAIPKKMEMHMALEML